MTFDERIYQYEFQMNDTDDEIVSYIQKNRANIIDFSIQKIAADLYIAPNSVMRLAKKLGYSGFSELKFSLQNEEKPGNEKQTLSSQLLGQLPMNIVKTLDTLDENILKKTVQKMYNARCCIFAGVGDSSYFCEIFGKNLRCLDVSVQYFTQIHDMFYAVRHGNAHDLLIVISARGINPRLLELSKEAHCLGMQVVSITHCYPNPLQQSSDINLYFWGEDREIQGYNVTDRSGLMVLIRLLSEEFWNRYMGREKE